LLVLVSQLGQVLTAVEAVLVVAVTLPASPAVDLALRRLSPVAAHALAEEPSAGLLAHRNSIGHRNSITVALACLSSGRGGSPAQSPDRRPRLPAGEQR